MSTSRRTEAVEARREQIVAAARHVFAEKGYDGATVADIVAAAGVAQGTFYLYFPSKKAVVIALADMYLSGLNSTVMAGYAPTRPLAECIRPMVHAAFVWCKENRDLARLFRFTLDVEAAEALEAAQARQAMTAMIAAILAERVKAGEVVPLDLEVTERLLTGLVREACHQCYVFGDGSEAQRYEDAAVAIIGNALLRRR